LLASASALVKEPICGWKMQEAKIGDTGRHVIEQTCMVFGQMNEATRSTVAGSLVCANHGRIFSAIKPGPTRCVHRQHFPASRRPVAKCRHCSAVCPAPWLSTDGFAPKWAPCRNELPRPRAGPSPAYKRCTCRRRRPTDPARHGRSASWMRFLYLERAISEKGIYPASNPLASSSRILDPQYDGASAIMPIAPPRARYFAALTAKLQTSSPILGVEELSEGRQTGRQPGPAHSSGSSRSRSWLAEVFTGKARRDHAASRNHSQLRRNLRR